MFMTSAIPALEVETLELLSVRKAFESGGTTRVVKNVPHLVTRFLITDASGSDSVTKAIHA